MVYWWIGWLLLFVLFGAPVVHREFKLHFIRKRLDAYRKKLELASTASCHHSTYNLKHCPICSIELSHELDDLKEQVRKCFPIPKAEVVE